MKAIEPFKGILRYIKTTIFILFAKTKSIFRIGDYWYWMDNEKIADDIIIEELVYPYRYDILIRKQFFEMYEKNYSDYKNNFERLMSDACKSEYFIWFRYVVVPRYLPTIKDNQEAVLQAFKKRIQASAELYDNIKANGFDKQYPIIPYTAEVILLPINGGIESPQYFMGDGCHRLACLMGMGYQVIPKEFVRVKCFARYQPYNNTSMLSPYLKTAQDWQTQIILGDG